jgi:hypothetical protein
MADDPGDEQQGGSSVTSETLTPHPDHHLSPKSWHTWKQAAVWALAAALLFEFVMNLFSRQTLWHRIESLELRVSHLERIHEQDDLLQKQRELQLEKEKNKH